MRPVFLVGMMGSGKSTVGASVARRLGREFCDLDRRIELLFGGSIASMWQDGEPGFRARETAALRSLLDEPGFAARGAVVACGGGTVLDPGSLEAMASAGTVVFLSVPIERLAERLQGHDGARPLLGDAPLLPVLAGLWRAREPSYRRAQVTVDADAALDEVAARVIAALPSAGGAP